MPTLRDKPSLDLAAIDDVRSAAARLVRRHRRAIVAGLLVLAALSSIRAIGDSTVDLRTVVVAADDLAAGHALTESDLSLVEVAAGTVADDAATDVSGLLGRRVATAVSAREPLTPTRLIAATAASAGTVVSAVRLADPHVAELLSAGDVVDVLAARGSSLAGVDAAADEPTDAGPTPARVVASSVRVVGIPQARGGTGSSLLGDTGRWESSGLVLLEVDEATAARLAGAAATARLSVSVRGQ